MLEYMADINACVLYMCMCCVCCRCVCMYVQMCVVVCVSLSIQYKCTRLSVQECFVCRYWMLHWWQQHLDGVASCDDE